MKKAISLLLISGCLGACATMLPRRPTSLSLTVIDYSKYSDASFFITESNSVAFDYKPLGSLMAGFQSGYETVKNDVVAVPVKKKKWYDDNEAETPKPAQTTNVFIAATPEKSVDELVKKAKEIGANGLINLKVVYVPSVDAFLRYDSYHATGMAIRK